MRVAGERLVDEPLADPPHHVGAVVGLLLGVAEQPLHRPVPDPPHDLFQVTSGGGEAVAAALGSLDDLDALQMPEPLGEQRA